MASYVVNIDREDKTTLSIKCGGNLERARKIALAYNAKYGYDSYIMATTCVFKRVTKREE